MVIEGCTWSWVVMDSVKLRQPKDYYDRSMVQVQVVCML